MSQFRIEEKITESGSTTVYRAFQEALARPVLLKVLHQHLAKLRPGGRGELKRPPPSSQWRLWACRKSTSPSEYRKLAGPSAASSCAVSAKTASRSRAQTTGAPDPSVGR